MFDTFGPIVVVIVFGAIIGMDKRDRIKEIEFKGYLSDIQRYELFTLTTDMGLGSQKVHCFAVREWRVGGKDDSTGSSVGQRASTTTRLSVKNSLHNGQ